MGSENNLRAILNRLKDEGGNLESILPTIELIRAEKARRSLFEFSKNSKRDYKAGWVHEEICKQLQKFYDDCKAGLRPR